MQSFRLYIFTPIFKPQKWHFLCGLFVANYGIIKIITEVTNLIYLIWINDKLAREKWLKYTLRSWKNQRIFWLRSCIKSFESFLDSDIKRKVCNNFYLFRCFCRVSYFLIFNLKLACSLLSKLPRSSCFLKNFFFVKKLKIMQSKKFSTFFYYIAKILLSVLLRVHTFKIIVLKSKFGLGTL